MHPDTRCIGEVTFFVASNEGNILISCTTSLALVLIKQHDRLDHIPPEHNVISSMAEKIKDESHLNVHMLSRKPKLKSSKEGDPLYVPLINILSQTRNLLPFVQRNNLIIQHIKEIQDIRTVKLIKVIYIQSNQQWICSQVSQQCTYRCKKLCHKKMTRTVSLQSIMNQCVLTRNVKLLIVTRQLTEFIKCSQ